MGQAPNADQSSLDSNFDLKDPFKWLSIYSEFPSNIYDSLNTFMSMRTSYSKEMKLYSSVKTIFSSFFRDNVRIRYIISMTVPRLFIFV